MREPRFWWRKPGVASALLAPLGAIYGAVAERRMRTHGAHAGAPVVCVGNFTLGGAGKTPTVIALVDMLREAGQTPVCLTRGYGGSERGPRLVDPHGDGASAVGDEPLLLGRTAPTVVARDRAAGAAFALKQGASVILMDDGLQSPSLAKDFVLAVIDAGRGAGNGFVFPAGPLRAPLPAQLARSDALLVVGDGQAAASVAAAARARGLPVWHGRLEPDTAAVAKLAHRGVLAFAGIGNPEKFFATIVAAGLTIGARQAFPDHHRFTAEEAADLIMRAEQASLALITTEKDRARMTGDPALAALAQRTHVLPVHMRFDETEAVKRTLLAAIATSRPA